MTGSRERGYQIRQDEKEAPSSRLAPEDQADRDGRMRANEWREVKIFEGCSRLCPARMPIGLGFRSRMLADSVRRARSELTPPSPPAHPGPHPRGISVSWTGARPGWAGLGDTSWPSRYFQRHPDNDGSRGPYYVASECLLGGSREWGRSYLLGSSRGLVCGGWVPGSGLRAPGQSGAIKLPRRGMRMLRGYLLVEVCFQGSVMRVLSGVQEGCASCEFRGGGVVYAKRGWGFGLRFVL